ncbi:hypothetical protein [Pseudotamlana carrageenivorans]|nr:hypothetical protein [Tamlana carrageenivorans]
MKQFLKNGLLFLILFFILEKGTYCFLEKAPKREYDKRLELIINGKMNKEVVVLGSSRGGGNILAEQIEKETGFTSYNLSYQGANITFQEFILRTLLTFNKVPKKVVLAIDNPHEFTIVPSLNFRLDRLYPLSKYNYINNELISQKDRSILSKFFYLDRINTSNFKIEIINAPSLNPMESRGSRPVIKRKKTKDLIFSNKSSDYSTKDESPKYVNAFKNIQILCKENNIQLIFVFSPNFHVFNYQFKNRFETLMLEGNKVVVYDSLNPIYENKSYFYDESHLLKEGAEVFTSEISAFINNNK